MQALTIVAYTALLLFVFAGLRYLLVMIQLMGMTLKTPSVRSLDRAQLPPHLEGLFADKERELQELGFRFSCAFAIEDMICVPVSQTHGLQYYHPEKKSYANLSESSDADAVAPTSITFISILRNGQHLETVNGKKHMIVGPIPRTQVEDPYAETVRQQWDFHLLRLSRLHPDDFRPFADSPEEREKNCSESNAIFCEYMAGLLKRGTIYRERGGGLRFRAWAAFRFASQILGGLRKVQVLKKKMGAAAPPQPLPLEMEVAHYQRQRYLMEQKQRRSPAKLLLATATLVLFVLAFKLVLGMDWFSLMVILGVLLLHEGGHLLAMHFTGYTNLSMLFIPLMGAVAMGSDAKITPTKRAITFFAGPVPGILLGLLLLSGQGNWQSLAQSSPKLFTVILFLLLINYFNLIPILPLDGGQLFNTIIFSRFRLLQNAFILVSIAGMVVLGVLLKTPILLALALLLPFGFWSQHLQQKYLFLLQERHPRPSEVSEENLIQHSFLLLKEGQAAKLPFAKKFQITKHIHDHYFTRRASAGTIAVVLLLYAALIAWPVITIVLPAARDGVLAAEGNPCARIQQARPSEGTIVAKGRFQRLDGQRPEDRSPTLMRVCFLEQDHWQEASASFFLSKLWTLYGEPSSGKNTYYYCLHDRVSGATFTAVIHPLTAGYDAHSDQKSLQAIHCLERLLESTSLADCSLEMDLPFPNSAEDRPLEERGNIRYRIGAKEGKPFTEVLNPWNQPSSPNREGVKPI